MVWQVLGEESKAGGSTTGDRSPIWDTIHYSDALFAILVLLLEFYFVLHALHQTVPQNVCLHTT